MIMSKINNFCTKRVEISGASYLSFGIFGLLNYPLSYLYYLYYAGSQEYESFLLRLIATLLCMVLSVHTYWPKKFKIYLPLYWYSTLLFCLPFIGSYLLLYNHFSISWLMNIVLALFLLILVVDWLMFGILMVCGTIIGFFAYILSGESLYWVVEHEQISMAIYMYLFTIVIGGIFSRNREALAIEREKNTAVVKKINNSLELKVQERTIALEEALAYKTEFLNNLSHEVKTPIQGFTIMSEGLVEHWQEFDEAKRLSLASNVANNAQRLASLVSNLLDLSKFTANRMEMHFSSVNFNDIMKDVIDECYRLYLNQKSIHIKFEEVDNLTTMVDKERIAQVLRNLFVNAIRFSPDEGTLTVSMSYVNEGDLCFQIVDTGVGIPENEIEMIFESFTQSTRTKTRAGGTGLGLSICKQIIEAHNGKIWAENNLSGEGSKFSFIIPLHQN
jgi:signal transduction histidine kinase